MHSALSATCMEQRNINSGPATAPLRSSLHGGSSHSAHSSRRYMHGCPVTAPTALNATGMEAQPQRSTLHEWRPSHSTHSAQLYRNGGPATTPTARFAIHWMPGHSAHSAQPDMYGGPATALNATCMDAQPQRSTLHIWRPNHSTDCAYRYMHEMPSHSAHPYMHGGPALLRTCQNSVHRSMECP